MDRKIDQIKKGFLKYLLDIALGLTSASKHQSLLDDLDFVINCDLEIRNTPAHNELLRWGACVLERVNRGLV